MTATVPPAGLTRFCCSAFRSTFPLPSALLSNNLVPIYSSFSKWLQHVDCCARSWFFCSLNCNNNVLSVLFFFFQIIFSLIISCNAINLSNTEFYKSITFATFLYIILLIIFFANSSTQIKSDHYMNRQCDFVFWLFVPLSRWSSGWVSSWRLTFLSCPLVSVFSSALARKRPTTLSNNNNSSSSCRIVWHRAFCHRSSPWLLPTWIAALLPKRSKKANEPISPILFDSLFSFLVCFYDRCVF